MAKIKFTLETWLKDKSQKVETRDGRIVHDIWRVKEPFYVNNRKAEVCALIDGEEDALVFFDGGRYLPTAQDTDNPFDLFIITPEQELTPFEDGLRQVCEEAVKEAAVSPDRTSEDFAKTHSAKLLDLAKKEVLKDLPRWKKAAQAFGNYTVAPTETGEYCLLIDGYFIMLSTLEKLPGFKED